MTDTIANMIDSVHCADCLEFMKQLPDSCVDLVLTDPPYGIERSSGSTNILRAKAAYENEYFPDTREYVRAHVIPVIRECLRVGRAVIVTPGSLNIDLYPQNAALGVFYQPASVGLNKWGRADANPILYYGKDPLAGKRIQPNSFVLTERPSCDLHPCSKPQKAWTKLLRKGSLEGDLVLDPFFGSGTTGVAAVRMGRHFIGIEINPDYCRIAEKRIQEERDKYALFAKGGD